MPEEQLLPHFIYIAFSYDGTQTQQNYEKQILYLYILLLHIENILSWTDSILNKCSSKRRTNNKHLKNTILLQNKPFVEKKT